MCPTEEESDMLMSSMMVNVHMCGGVGEKGVFGVRQGADNGAVDLEHGTSMGRRSHSHTKGNHSKSRGLFFYAYQFTTHALDIVYVFCLPCA